MKKKIYLLLFLSFLFTLPSMAVLKEKNLNKTLSVLKAELEETYKQNKRIMSMYEQSNKVQHLKLIEFMQKSEQISLMLYSQKADFTFDLAYACQQATEQYRKLRDNNLPYDKIKDRITQEVERYDGLIQSLSDLPPRFGGKKKHSSHMHHNESELMALADSLNEKTEKVEIHPFLLNEQEQADRDQCILYAKAIRNNLVRMLSSILKDSQHYERVNKKLKKLNDYAMNRYNYLQNTIFINGGDNYFTQIKKIRRNYMMAQKDINDKYLPLKEKRANSEWRGPIILSISIFIIFYIAVATILSNIILRFLLPKRIRQNRNFKIKRPLLMLLLGVAIFAISVMIAKFSIEQNFIIMACNLMINFAWLLAAILVSLIIRLKGNQLKAGIKIYYPFLWMAFIVIAFRIILITNNIVNLIYPPILLLFTIWQYHEIKHRKVRIPESDIIYSAISLAAMVIATVMAWSGYVLLAVQIMIWWIFQLAAIQTITCAYDLISMFEKHYMIKDVIKKFGPDALKKGRLYWIKAIHDGHFIYRTWFFDLISKTIMPILAVISVLQSIFWAAAVFDMTAMCKTIFFYNFIDKAGVLQLSIFKISLVVSCWYLFRYLNYAIRSFYLRFKTKRIINQKANLTLARNIIGIVIWGSYFIFALILLQVPKSGISLVTAGLATGLGFAMKDLLENFFYGISLMTGRVRVDDYIECDGILGKVESINYQSTQIVTRDGSIIAFLNASLFSKNFKNLTKNHNYELVKVPIGVAYGADIKQIRKLLINAISPLITKNSTGKDIISRKQGLNVVISEFGDNSVNLYVVFWVLVEEKASVVCKVNEIIYDTLNENNIEIPFPQRDIYIRKINDIPENVTPADTSKGFFKKKIEQ